MCDYSLHGIPNRLAQEGESLVVRQFPTGSKGLAAVPDLQKKAQVTATSSLANFWQSIRSWFVVEIEKTVPAVCIPPGARLHVENIPPRLQEALHVSASEDVTFVQLSAEPFQYRDAIKFENGREVLLQRLNEGLRMDVVSLGVTEEVSDPEHSFETNTLERASWSSTSRHSLSAR